MLEILNKIRQKYKNDKKINKMLDNITILYNEHNYKEAKNMAKILYEKLGNDKDCKKYAKTVYEFLKKLIEEPVKKKSEEKEDDDSDGDEDRKGPVDVMDSDGSSHTTDEGSQDDDDF